MTKNSLRGSFAPPGDKSITHRALIFSALCKGGLEITGISPAQDCVSTADCMRALGLDIRTSSHTDTTLQVQSPGLDGLIAPDTVLDAGNSGTTMRIMSGLVAGRSFKSTFDGDASLRRRPMSRVLDLLGKMGAGISYEPDSKFGCAPFSVQGGRLEELEFILPIASAQVQTALLLAGLQAEGKTTVRLPQVARDHTLRMFKHLGVPFTEIDALTISVSKLTKAVPGARINVPADISSAAFFLVGAALLPGSDITLKNCGISPGRALIVDVLKRMGADIVYENSREDCGEPVTDMRIRYNGRLHGTTISGDEIAAGIDEIPVISLAGALCDGELIVEGAEELRHKESDRLEAIVNNLRQIGAVVSDRQDGFTVTGVPALTGGSWQTYDDHRLAMSGLISTLICEGPVSVSETESIKISYPGFKQDLQNLVGGQLALKS